jgi:hypothetical protein
MQEQRAKSRPKHNQLLALLEAFIFFHIVAINILVKKYRKITSCVVRVQQRTINCCTWIWSRNIVICRSYIFVFKIMKLVTGPELRFSVIFVHELVSYCVLRHNSFNGAIYFSVLKSSTLYFSMGFENWLY